MKVLNPGLLLAISVVSLSLFGAESPKSPADAKGFKNVDVNEFEKLAANKQNQVLDVRTPAEFAKGHLPGAVNIDINGAEFEQKIAALDKKKTYLVHCAAGARSTRACQKMGQLKFPALYNLEGGLKAWEKAGKPVEK